MLALKVDEHKYYDGLLGAINAALFLRRDAQPFKSLRSKRENKKSREENLVLSVL